MEITVDHDTALTSRAVERYILEEMNDAEAEDFEAHYFECPSCAQDVQETDLFVKSGRLTVQHAREASAIGPPVRSWHHPKALLPYAAILPLAFVALYQTAVKIPRLERYSQPVAVEATMLRIARAAIPVVSVTPGRPTFLIAFDLIDPDASSHYQLEFQTSAGAPAATLETAAPETGTLHVIMPSTRFPPGDYTMTLRAVGAGGESGRTIEQYPFRVTHGGTPEPRRRGN